MRKSGVALAWLATLAGAVVLACVGQAGPAGFDRVSFSVVFIGLAVDVSVFASVGAVLALRRPENNVGAVLLGASVLIVVAFLGFILGAVLAAERGADDTVAGWLSLIGTLAIDPALIVAGPLLALLFPDGHLPDPRWRWPIAAIAGLLAVGSALVIAQPGTLGDSLAENPFGISGLSWLEGAGELGVACTTIALISSLVIAVPAVVVRFRRANGVERQQLKWFVAAYSAVVGGLVLGSADGGTEPTPIDLLAVVSLSLPPLAVGIAILRYRLYEIDRIVSRTLAYVVMTGLLVATYGLLVVIVGGPLADVTGGDTISIAISTLTVAALFQPLRRRVQTVLDRRFDRARYDAARTVEAFTDRLRYDVDLAAVSQAIVVTATAAVRPASAVVWLRRAGR